MHGIHTALVTPFDARGDIDLGAFEALCARQIEAGVHGLVPCGTTGETPTLEGDEWVRLVSAAVRVSAGRVPVTAGVGSNSTAATVRQCRLAREHGADQGLIVLPYYNKPNPDGHRRHLAAALEVGLPLVVYHVPGRTGQVVPAKLLAELASMPGVAGVKEATGDLRYGTDVIRGTTAPVLSGDDFTFLGLLAQGGAGCVSVVSNVAPAETVGVYDAWQAGRVDEARERFHGIYELVSFLFSDTNPVPCKAALAALGLCQVHTRLPLASWSGELPAALVQRALR